MYPTVSALGVCGGMPVMDQAALSQMDDVDCTSIIGNQGVI